MVLEDGEKIQQPGDLQGRGPEEFMVLEGEDPGAGPAGQKGFGRHGLFLEGRG